MADANSTTHTQSPHTTHEHAAQLPILYRDGAFCGLFYRVDLARAAELFTGLTVEPWPFFGTALAAIYAFEYRDSSIGPYVEVGLGIQARRRGTRPSLLRFLADMSAQNDQGIFVLSLPVTTEVARSAGVSLWGYPKYISPITAQFDDHGARVQLGTELELSMRGMVGVRGHLPIVTFSELAGKLIRTSVTVATKPTLGVPLGASLHVLGDGPSARIVRALGMHEQRPLAGFHGQGFRATLPLGTELGTARAR